MSVRFAPGADADFGECLENIARVRGEDAATAEAKRVLGELMRLIYLGVTGRSVRIEGEPAEVYRWVVKRFVVYYVRTEGFVVLRVFHGRRRPIER